MRGVTLASVAYARERKQYGVAIGSFQAVGHAALSVAGSQAVVDGEDVALKIYLYSRAQSVMGGTSQIQKNIIAQRILGLPAR